MRYGSIVPQSLVDEGGPKYLVGVVSDDKRVRGDEIEFGPLGVGGIGIQLRSVEMGQTCTAVFTAADIREIIDGLTQCLEDCKP